MLFSENYCMIIVVSDIAPGLSSLFKLSLPDQKSNKVRISFLSNEKSIFSFLMPICVLTNRWKRST